MTLKTLALTAAVAFALCANAAQAQTQKAATPVVFDELREATIDSALNDSVAKAEEPIEKPVVKRKTAAKGSTVPKSMTKDYIVQAGDVLQIAVWKEDNLDREVVVLSDSTIDFPLIGSFSVAGMTPPQVQATIKEKLRSLIPGASVSVVVKAPLGHSVSVIGQVNKPGEIVMSHSMTVMQALSQAGGLTPYASESRIKILRKVDGKETSIPFPYDDVVDGDNLEQNINLFPGDVVVVPTSSLF